MYMCVCLISLIINETGKKNFKSDGNKGWFGNWATCDLNMSLLINQKKVLFVLVKCFVLILFKFYHGTNSVINHVILSEHKFSTFENEKLREYTPKSNGNNDFYRKIR